MAAARASDDLDPPRRRLRLGTTLSICHETICLANPAANHRNLQTQAEGEAVSPPTASGRRKHWVAPMVRPPSAATLSPTIAGNAKRFRVGQAVGGIF